MKFDGERELAATREVVWRALNDPEVLKSCIPGCDAIEPQGDDGFKARVRVRVGPVGAGFDTVIRLRDIEAPESYTLVATGKGGAAGLAEGIARVRLIDRGATTALCYDTEFNVQGKLAQVGSRLMMSAAHSLVTAFFDRLAGHFS